MFDELTHTQKARPLKHVLYKLWYILPFGFEVKSYNESLQSLPVSGCGQCDVEEDGKIFLHSHMHRKHVRLKCGFVQCEFEIFCDIKDHRAHNFTKTFGTNMVIYVFDVDGFRTFTRLIGAHGHEDASGTFITKSKFPRRMAFFGPLEECCGFFFF